jgi:hypothetical protein
MIIQHAASMSRNFCVSSETLISSHSFNDTRVKSVSIAQIMIRLFFSLFLDGFRILVDGARRPILSHLMRLVGSSVTSEHVNLVVSVNKLF